VATAWRWLESRARAAEGEDGKTWRRDLASIRFRRPAPGVIVYSEMRGHKETRGKKGCCQTIGDEERKVDMRALLILTNRPNLKHNQAVVDSEPYLKHV
jgi:hypothetical protein